MLKEAHSVSLEYTPNRIGLNDSAAYVIMINHGYNEIYSFDKNFDTLKGIMRIDK